MIYRFRVILDHDSEGDVFRDIEIRETDSLEDLHNAITQSFGFDGLEMASFYLSNDQWDQGEEISLFDLSVELAEIVDEAEGTDYPNLMFVHGQLPDSAPEKNFEAEDLEDDYNEFENDLDIDDYDNLDFDENWN